MSLFFHHILIIHIELLRYLANDTVIRTILINRVPFHQYSILIISVDIHRAGLNLKLDRAVWTTSMSMYSLALVSGAGDTE